LVATGTKKQPQFAGVADDIHSLLYLRSTPPAHPGAPQWATDLLAQAQDLAEWKPLRARCLQSGFQAGLATEYLLRALVDLAPRGTPDQQHGQESFQVPGQGQPGEGGGDTRRTLRQALRQAGKAVDEAAGAMEGIGEALGIHAGTQPGQGENLVELEQVRGLWELMGQSDMLKLIAQMAGRLTRLAHSTKRSKGQSHVGAITGLTIGGDLARILPQELAGLRGARLARLQVLGKIAGRKALQYDVKGDVPEGRGPMLVLLDKSSSMRTPRTRLYWSKAVALALLTLCREQGRTWGCVTFDYGVSKEVVVEGGRVTDQDALMEVLLQDATGGTDFTAPLSRALTLLTDSPCLTRADIIFVTDGEGDVDDATREALAQRMAEDGLSLYGIGIGGDADLTTLKPVATACYQVSSDPQHSDGAIAPMLAQLA